MNQPVYIWWIEEFGRLTGYSLILVHHIGTGKLWWINENSLYSESHALYELYHILHIIHVSWLKVTSKELTYVHFPCTSSEQVKLMYFLTKPDYF